MDDDNAELFAVRNGAEAADFAIIEDVAVIGSGRIDAAEHLPSGRLAGAVCADERVDSPRAPEADIVQRFHAGNVFVMPRISRMICPWAEFRQSSRDKSSKDASSFNAYRKWVRDDLADRWSDPEDQLSICSACSNRRQRERPWHWPCRQQHGFSRKDGTTFTPLL